jgi:hypothetical protein
MGQDPHRLGSISTIYPALIRKSNNCLKEDGIGINPIPSITHQKTRELSVRFFSGSRKTVFVMPEKQSSNNKSLRGVDVLNNPRRNRGTAFAQKEREDLGLVGLLPAGIETLDQQVDRVLGNLAQKPTDLEKYIYRANGIGVRAITEIHGWRIC